MGTTLTGTTPQDTYDSLIKVTDNAPLTGSLKVLTDGLGNDSALALSTGAASVTGTLAVTASASLATASGNVGIGTSAPTAGYKFDVRGRTIAYNAGYIADFVSTESNASTIQMYADNTQVSIVQGGTAAVPLTFFVGGTEKVRFQSGGGISFNGDTAAANALDDYEEGTWTMGVSFGGASVDVTFAANTGSYTKIGRQVTVNGFLFLSNKGSSTGDARITGLPFTIGNGDSFFSAASVVFFNVTFANQLQLQGTQNSTAMELLETTEAGVLTAITNADFTNNTGIIVSLTYFV